MSTKIKVSRAIGILAVFCFILTAAWGYHNELAEKKAVMQTALRDHIDDFGDTTDTVTIDGEEVPLGKPKVTTKTSTKTKTKKYKLKKAVKKAKTTKKTSTKTKSSTKETSKKKVVTKTTIKTTVKTTLKKKTKTVKTTVKTTVRTTTTAKNAAAAGGNMQEVGTSSAKGNASKIDDLKGIVAPDIIAVFKELGFTVEIDTKEAKAKGYSGCFSPSRKKIILARGDTATLIHEVGHFISFIKFGGDSKEEFIRVYESDKARAAKFYRLASYTTKARNEYFAESISTFYMNGAKLKSQCPKTYAYMQSVINSVSMQDAANVKSEYGW